MTWRLPTQCWLAAQHERDRWGLWVPAGIGAGVGLYFALPVEPGLEWLLLLPACVLLLLPAALRPYRLACILLLLPALGFNAAQLETWRSLTPMLKQPLYAPELSGRVAELEPSANGVTLTLDKLEIAALAPQEVPRLLRLKLSRSLEKWPEVGSRVELAAMLMPLSEPAAPGAYDFRRDGFFRGIGGQGFVRGALRVVAPAPERPGLMQWIERLRQTVAQRVLQQISGDAGQIATALLNGGQGGISERAKADLRAAGLYHIVSISGLHLAVVTALLFTGLRRLLALFPYAALYWPIKKISAFFAMLVLPFYILLVGEPVPAVRCALMAMVVLLGVIVERRALSLRLVALAATGLLLLAPHAMLGASFQLSFAAVTVMVAGYEALRRWRQSMPAAQEAEPGLALRWWRLGWRYGGGMVLTSLLAGLATAPFTLFQFQQANGYGVAANMLGIPLTTFIIMPAGFLGYLLMPLGLETWPLMAMGWGIEKLLQLSAWVALWPGATLTIPAFSTGSFLLILFGGLWLCLWQRRWRCWGVAAVLAGALQIAYEARPSILLAPQLSNWAVRQEEGLWLAGKAGGKDFIVKQWEQRSGDAVFEPWERAADPEVMRCDGLGCRYRQNGKSVALAWDSAALQEDCGAVDLIVTTLWRVDCPLTPVLSGAMLKWRGAADVTLLADAAPIIRFARARWGGRPWSPGWKPKTSSSVGQAVLPPAAEAITDKVEAQQERQEE